jgi:hypothetical protein
MTNDQRKHHKIQTKVLLTNQYKTSPIAIDQMPPKGLAKANSLKNLKA